MSTIRLLGWLLAVSATASFVAGQDLRQQQNTAEPEAQAVQTTRLSEQSLNILYTKTNVRLAELELERALELNSKGYRVVPRLTVERLRSNLAIAQEQYQRAKSDSSGGLEKVRLKHAQEKLRLAQMDMDAAHELKERNTLSDWELKRVELKLDLAKLKVALLQHPTGYLTLIDSMQRQLDQFGIEILALDQRISKLEGSQLSR